MDYPSYRVKFEGLQQKIRQSEMERQELEMKFEQLMRRQTEKEKWKLKSLKGRYKEFLEDEKKRTERNERLLQTLDRIDFQAASLAAKSERLKMLKSQYELMLMRTYSAPPMPSPAMLRSVTTFNHQPEMRLTNYYPPVRPGAMTRTPGLSSNYLGPDLDQCPVAEKPLITAGHQFAPPKSTPDIGDTQRRFDHLSLSPVKSQANPMAFKLDNDSSDWRWTMAAGKSVPNIVISSTAATSQLDHAVQPDNGQSSAGPQQSKLQAFNDNFGRLGDTNGAMDDDDYLHRIQQIAMSSPHHPQPPPLEQATTTSQKYYTGEESEWKNDGKSRSNLGRESEMASIDDGTNIDLKAADRMENTYRYSYSHLMETPRAASTSNTIANTTTNGNNNFNVQTNFRVRNNSGFPESGQMAFVGTGIEPDEGENRQINRNVIGNIHQKWERVVEQVDGERQKSRPEELSDKQMKYERGDEVEKDEEGESYRSLKSVLSSPSHTRKYIGDNNGKNEKLEFRFDTLEGGDINETAPRPPLSLGQGGGGGKEPQTTRIEDDGDTEAPSGLLNGPQFPSELNVTNRIENQITSNLNKNYMFEQDISTTDPVVVGEEEHGQDIYNAVNQLELTGNKNEVDPGREPTNQNQEPETYFEGDKIPSYLGPGVAEGYAGHGDHPVATSQDEIFQSKAIENYDQSGREYIESINFNVAQEPNNSAGVIGSGGGDVYLDEHANYSNDEISPHAKDLSEMNPNSNPEQLLPDEMPYNETGDPSAETSHYPGEYAENVPQEYEGGTEMAQGYQQPGEEYGNYYQDPNQDYANYSQENYQGNYVEPNFEGQPTYEEQPQYEEQQQYSEQTQEQLQSQQQQDGAYVNQEYNEVNYQESNYEQPDYSNPYPGQSYETGDGMDNNNYSDQQQLQQELQPEQYGANYDQFSTSNQNPAEYDPNHYSEQVQIMPENENYPEGDQSNFEFTEMSHNEDVDVTIDSSSIASKVAEEAHNNDTAIQNRQPTGKLNLLASSTSNESNQPQKTRAAPAPQATDESDFDFSSK